MSKNSLFTGWYDKRNLHQWDKEDTANLYKCEWIKSYSVTQNFKNDRERKKYFNDLYERLVLTLPKEDLEELNERVNNCSRIRNRRKFERIVTYAVTRMRSKLLAHDYQKEKELERQLSSTKKQGETTFNQFRANMMIKENSMKQEKKVSVEEEYSRPGYYPTMEVLLRLPPMEIIDYVGFRLIKYDKFGGYYAAILRYPKELYKETEIMYNENAQVLESEAEYKFDEEVNKYIQSKSNPYGDKTYNNIDISNIEQVMGGNPGSEPINPLDGDIF